MSITSAVSREWSREFNASVCDGRQLWCEFRYSSSHEELAYDNAAIYQTPDVGLMWVTWTTRYEPRQEARALWNEFMGGVVTRRTPVQSFAGAFSWYLDWNPPPPREQLTVDVAKRWTELLQTFEAMDRLRGWL